MTNPAMTPFQLETKLEIDFDLLSSPNLVPRFTEDELKNIGHVVVEDFERDLDSRSDWAERMDVALKLALQVKEPKTFPWEGAANIRFPLVTIAAIQYQSRAYPALINGPQPIACAPFSVRPSFSIPPELAAAAQSDPQAKAALQQLTQQALSAMADWKKLDARAKRIARHMSTQILEEDPTWEENHDKSLFIQALLGCVFKKTYFDPVLGRNCSDCVSPRDLVVSYFTKSLETSPRVTHVLYLYPNDCHERVERGIFSPFSEGSPNPEPSLHNRMSEESDKRQGISGNPGDHDAPYDILEQYRNLDLDHDGYAEPYVITVRRDTRQVLRIVARYTRKGITFTPTGRIIRIEPINCFTKYPFIPSPDGGFYDLGFGALLGPITETVSSAINQLLDAGTFSNAGGGFLGRGFRNKRGEYRFKPGEWKSVDSSGDDLRKNVFPLPAPQPSPTLFQLLSLLIEYTESIAGATDILQGKNPGQNTPAETSRAMVEQGMKVFNGIYKRTHRAFTQEVRKLFHLNTIFISDTPPYVSSSLRTPPELAKDYEDSNMVVKAAADPFYMSDAQRYNQAASLHAAALSTPGYDLYEVNSYYLEALKLPNPERFLPDPKGPYAVPPPVNPKIQVEQIKEQGRQAERDLKFKIELIKLTSVADLQAAEIRLMEAQILKLNADAANEETGHKIALLNTQIAAAKSKQDGTLKAIELLNEIMHNTQESSNGASNTGPAKPMAGGPSNGGLAGLLTQASGGAPGIMAGGAVPK